MTAFFSGPPLLAHVAILGLINAVIFPLVYRRTGSFSGAVAVAIVFSSLCVIGALWYWRKR